MAKGKVEVVVVDEEALTILKIENKYRLLVVGGVTQE